MLVLLEMAWQVVDMACLLAIMVLFTFKELAECAITSNSKTCDELRSQLAVICPDQKTDEMWQPKSLDQYEICADGKGNPKISGIHDINVTLWNVTEKFRVVCDGLTQNGGWTIIMRRQDGSVSFNRKWNIYKRGFGDLDGEFFMGLDKIHALTAEKSQELLVVVESCAGVVYQQTYDKFAIGDESESYMLSTLGASNGTAKDMLRRHHGMFFSTRDRDNDKAAYVNCAAKYNAGWWYNACYQSLLTGVYMPAKSRGKGLNWGNKTSLEHVVMMIRPRSYRPRTDLASF